MKNNKEKKTSTIGLWLLLIVLLATAAGLTYLKYFYNEKIYYPEDIKLNSEIEEQLNEITNNFNKDTLTLEKLKENIVIEAKLQNDTIVVNYKEKNITKEYNYKYNNNLLETEIDEETEIFNQIFKIMVYATQKRLKNEKREEIDKYVNDFLNNENEIEGLYKEMVEANIITYNIEITKIIKPITEENDLEG